MGVVDFTFYSTVYMGTEADSTSFPALCARASDIIGAVTHWVDDAKILTLHEKIQTLYKKAICAQVDFLAINGIDSINETASAGWTVGKVTVHGKAGASAGGHLVPNADTYLGKCFTWNASAAGCFRIYHAESHGIRKDGFLLFLIEVGNIGQFFVIHASGHYDAKSQEAKVSFHSCQDIGFLYP